MYLMGGVYLRNNILYLLTTFIFLTIKLISPQELVESGLAIIETSQSNFAYQQTIQNNKGQLEAIATIVEFEASSLKFNVYPKIINNQQLIINVQNDTKGNIRLAVRYLIFQTDKNICINYYIPNSDNFQVICDQIVIYPNGKCLSFFSGISTSATSIQFYSSFNINKDRTQIVIQDIYQSQIQLSILCLSSIANYKLDYFLQEYNQDNLNLIQNPLSTQEMVTAISGQKIFFNLSKPNRNRILLPSSYKLKIESNQLYYDNTSIDKLTLIIAQFSLLKCSYYFQYSRSTSCEICHPNCMLCYGPLDTQCYSCQPNLYSFKQNNSMRCLSECPEGSYPLLQQSIDQSYSIIDQYICNQCSPNCLKCQSDRVCDQCSENNYLYQNTCHPSCPEQYFGDKSSQQCLSCHYSCKTCKGPLEIDCLTCDFGQANQKGYCKNSQVEQDQFETNEQVASYTTQIIKYGFAASIGPLILNSNLISLLNFIEGIQAVRYILYINIEYHEVVINFFEQLNPFTLTYPEYVSNLIQFSFIGSTPAFNRDQVDALFFQNGFILGLGFFGLVISLIGLLFIQNKMNEKSFIMKYLNKMIQYLESEGLLGYLHGSLFNFTMFSLLQLQDSSCYNWACFMSYIIATIFLIIVVLTLSKLISIICQITQIKQSNHKKLNQMKNNQFQNNQIKLDLYNPSSYNQQYEHVTQSNAPFNKRDNFNSHQMKKLNQEKETKKNQTDILDKYSFLFDELDTEMKNKIVFIALNPLRVIITSLNLVLLYKNPLVQLIIQQGLNLLAFLLILKYMPYKVFLMNIRDCIMSFLLILIHTLSMYQLNQTSLNEVSKEKFGWAIVYSCLAIGLSQLLVVIYLTCLSIKQLFVWIINTHRQKNEEKIQRQLDKQKIIQQQIEQEKQKNLDQIDQEQLVMQGHIRQNRNELKINDQQIQELISILDDQIEGQIREKEYIRGYQIYKLEKQLNQTKLDNQLLSNSSQISYDYHKNGNNTIIASFQMK